MAVTKYSPQSRGGGDSIVSAFTDAVSCACTNDATTTAQVFMGNYAMGTVLNASASSVTITYYAAMTEGGTAYALVDEDAVAVTQVVAATTAAALPSACAGVLYLLPVSSGATATLVYAFKR